MGGSQSSPAEKTPSLQHQFMATSILQMACSNNGSNHEIKYIQQGDKNCNEHYDNELKEIFSSIKQQHANKFADCTFDNLLTDADCKSKMFEFLNNNTSTSNTKQRFRGNCYSVVGELSLIQFDPSKGGELKIISAGGNDETSMVCSLLENDYSTTTPSTTTPSTTPPATTPPAPPATRLEQYLLK